MHTDDEIKQAAMRKLQSLDQNHLARLSSIKIDLSIEQGGIMQHYEIYFEKLGSDHRVLTWNPVQVVKLSK
jgi:hypothetical protein